jgi:hypothetical protein
MNRAWIWLIWLVSCGGEGAAVPDARPPGGDAALALDASGDAAPAPDAVPAPDATPLTGDIAVDLAATPGATVREGTSEISGYRFFILEYDQPVDHRQPDGPRFQQRLRLLHRAYDAPTVLVTEGYFVLESARRVELASLVSGNQISVEHRYFVPSRPDPAEWSKLEIWQAATDHHRVVEALRRIYGGRWLTAGSSKGGMAAVFHRRFYPDDVDGTVAYVAPLSFGRGDPRYIPFVDEAGPEGDCNPRLRAFQRLALGPTMRSQILSRMQSGFNVLGREQALEHTVLELPFGFWQYRRASSCGTIPGATATADQVWEFLVATGRLFDFGDEDLEDYAPYYYQANTQIGYPAMNLEPIADLLAHPYVIDDYVPESAAFDEAAMVDIDQWVRTEGERLLFIYGEYDPWTAGAFTLGEGSADCLKLTVPAGNHNAVLRQLSEGDYAAALDAIGRWAGVSLPPRAKPADEELAPMVRGEPRL